MDPQAQAILAIFTVLCSGVVSAAVTYKLSDRRASKDFRRSKLEDCFECFDRFAKQLTVNSLPILQVMDGKITWDEGNDMLSESISVSNTKNLLKVEMLTHLYFPELIEDFRSLLEVRDELASLRTAAKYCYLQQTNQEQEILARYKTAYYQLDDVENKFKQSLFSLVPK